MKKEQIFTDLQNEIVDHIGLEPEEVTMESSFRDDLGMDSLDNIELIMEMEKEYNISIPDDEVEKVNTVSEAVDYLFTYFN